MSTDTARPATFDSPRPAPPRDEPVVVFVALDEPPAQTEAVPAVPPAAAPAWFKGKTADPPASAPASASPAPQAASGPSAKPRGRLRIETAPEEDEHLTRSERFKRWLLGSPGLSYGASMLFHAALLVIMALIVYHTLPKDERGSLLLDTREEERISLDDIDTRIDLAEAQEDIVPPQFQAIPTPESDTDVELQADLDDVLPSLGGTGDGTGGGTGLALPRSERAVTRGSFTAWTIPEDPEPTKDYVIVIEIKLPDNVKTYRLVDLTGMVVGTDLYTQSIPYDPRNPSSTAAVRDGKPVTLRDARASVPVHDGRAQLLIRVPGAAELVKDTIRVRSKMLRESQELEIQFRPADPPRG